jgi:hypothetical protein
MRTSTLFAVLVVLATTTACAPEAVGTTGPSTPSAVTAPSTGAPTSAAAGPTPEPPPAQVHTGEGINVVNLANPVGPAIIFFECPRCEDDIRVSTNAGIDEDVIMDYEGGPYSGRQWTGMRGGVTSRIQVHASGPWTLTVSGLETASRHPGDQPVAGVGDDVLFLDTAPMTVRFTNKGESNFMVQLMTDSHQLGPDLVINEIGDYDGTVFFDVDGVEAGLVQVHSDGEWTMTPV